MAERRRAAKMTGACGVDADGADGTREPADEVETLLRRGDAAITGVNLAGAFEVLQRVQGILVSRDGAVRRTRHCRRATDPRRGAENNSGQSATALIGRGLAKAANRSDRRREVIFAPTIVKLLGERWLASGTRPRTPWSSPTCSGVASATASLARASARPSRRPASNTRKGPEATYTATVGASG
jgi:hypothetical protein